MFEKIKDFVYDISDYLVTIIIIFLIVISIAFVMTKSYGLDFSKNDLISLFNKEELVQSKEPPQVEPSKPTPPPEAPPLIEEEKQDDEEDKEVKEEDEEKKEKEEDEDKEVKEDKEDYILHIEPGDQSNSISERLEKAGVIKDAYELAVVLAERGLDTALQIGDFTFKKNMTIEQVIDVLFP